MEPRFFETVYCMGRVAGALNDREIREFFTERGVTDAEFEALDRALRPFHVATYRHPKGGNLGSRATGRQSEKTPRP